MNIEEMVKYYLKGSKEMAESSKNAYADALEIAEEIKKKKKELNKMKCRMREREREGARCFHTALAFREFSDMLKGAGNETE